MIERWLADLLVPDWAKAAASWVIKGGAAFLVAFGVFKAIETRGASKEQARVEKVGEKTDAKAEAKRRAAESRPDLSRWYRD